MFYRGEAELVIARTLEGDEGFMYGHSWACKLLDIGELWIQEKGAPKNSFKIAAVAGGFIEVRDSIIIYTDAIEWAEDIDTQRAMSEKMEAVATSEAPAALGAYSQAVKANGFVFVSGQLGIDPATGELAGETAGEQAAQALKNIKHILDTAGTGIEHVCRATIYLKNVEDFKEVDARYAEVFIGSVKPARVAFGTT